MQTLCVIPPPSINDTRRHTAMSFLSQQLAANDPTWAAAQAASAGPMTIITTDANGGAVAAWWWELGACAVSNRLAWCDKIVLGESVASEVRFYLQSACQMQTWAASEQVRRPGSLRSPSRRL